MTQHEIDVLILMIIFGALIITVFNSMSKNKNNYNQH